MHRMLTIEIVSDVVCPWCFIGTRRLETAIALVRDQIPDFTYQTRWLPFFLNPDTPPEGEPFGRIREAGRAYGIDYAFEKIEVRANTLRAHRLIHWAQQRGAADALVERLFVAQFQRGERVGDIALLGRIAAECGYDAAEVTRYLSSTEDEALVREREREIRAKGIKVVPTFILPGNQVIAGAEDPAVLAAAILACLR